MSNSQHTPGPWFVKGSQATGTLCVTDGDSAYVVDRFALGGHPPEQKMANARMIAEAPLMREILATVAGWIGRDVPVPEVRRVLYLARDVVARVDGLRPSSSSSSAELDQVDAEQGGENG